MKLTRIRHHPCSFKFRLPYRAKGMGVRSKRRNHCFWLYRHCSILTGGSLSLLQFSYCRLLWLWVLILQIDVFFGFERTRFLFYWRERIVIRHSFNVLLWILSLEMRVLRSWDFWAPTNFCILYVHLSLLVNSWIAKKFSVLNLSGIARVPYISWGNDVGRVLGSVLRLSQQSSRVTSNNSSLLFRRLSNILCTLWFHVWRISDLAYF